MRHDRITGQAAKAEPSINRLGRREVVVTDQVHASGLGKSRRERRPHLIWIAAQRRKVRRATHRDT